jgi:asparagine synthetase B (glutamine-hydrolysing)
VRPSFSYLYVPALCHRGWLPCGATRARLTIAGGSRASSVRSAALRCRYPLLREELFSREIEARLPEFEQHLLRAVADCLPTGGRLALTLSGGKDSSTLAVALSKICPDRVLAVNVGARDRRVDESGDARLVCEALGLPFQSYVPSDEALASGLYLYRLEGGGVCITRKMSLLQ